MKNSLIPQIALTAASGLVVAESNQGSPLWPKDGCVFRLSPCGSFMNDEAGRLLSTQSGDSLRAFRYARHPYSLIAFGLAA